MARLFKVLVFITFLLVCANASKSKIAILGGGLGGFSTAYGLIYVRFGYVVIN